MITITINLAYIYVPIIFIVSYFLLKFIIIHSTYFYLKVKYTKVESEIIKILYKSIKFVENEQVKNANLVDIRSLFIKNVNERITDVLPNMVSFNGRFDEDLYSDDLYSVYIENISISIKLIFPYWKTKVYYNPERDIWLDESEIMENYRNNAIDDLLND